MATAGALVLAAAVDKEWVEGVEFGAVMVLLGVLVGVAAAVRGVWGVARCHGEGVSW